MCNINDDNKVKESCKKIIIVICKLNLNVYLIWSKERLKTINSDLI